MLDHVHHPPSHGSLPLLDLQMLSGPSPASETLCDLCQPRRRYRIPDTDQREGLKTNDESHLYLFCSFIHSFIQANFKLGTTLAQKRHLRY